MKNIGIVRKLDPVGRLTLPIELRKQFRLRKGDELELFVDGDMVVLKKRKKQVEKLLAKTSAYLHSQFLFQHITSRI